MPEKPPLFDPKKQEQIERSAKSKRDNEENMMKIKKLDLGESSDAKMGSKESGERGDSSFERDSEQNMDYDDEKD